MKHKSRRFLALFMVFNMAFSTTYATFFPGAVIQAKAQESTMEDQTDGGGQNVSATFDGQEATADEEGVYILPGIEVTASVDEDEFPDNDTLFEQYVDSVFGIEEEKKSDEQVDDVATTDTQSIIACRETRASSEAMLANVYLTGQDLIIYNDLRPKVKAVADGELDSAVFTVPVSELLDQTEYSAEELGVESIVVDGAINPDASAALYAKLTYSISQIGKTLLRNCPYDMYWMAKTYGWGAVSPSVGTSYKNNQYYIKFCMTKKDANGKLVVDEDAELVVTFQFYVDQAFSATNASKTYDVDTAKTGAAKLSAANALEIVNEAAAETDYEKLVFYKDQICDLVSYNHAAANQGVSTYGTISPWQLIYVFDKDSATNVVCEGYSKAFQYLCDLTDFNNDDIYAYSLTGTMNGGTGAGAHMWNHVHMEDDKNYLVDVTNCDAGSVGSPDKLFMRGYSTASYNSSDVMDGYGIKVSDSTTIIYSYYDPDKDDQGNVKSDTLDAYKVPELTLADEDYNAGPKHLTNVPSALNACVGTTITDDLLANYTGWEWDTGVAGTAVPNTVGGTLVRTAVYNGSDKAEYDNTEANVTITAAAHNFNAQGICTRCGMKNIAVYPADGSIHVSTVYYTGSEQTVSITVDGLAVDTDYTVSGVTSGTNVGTYTATLTGTGSYTGTRNVTWTISYYSADAEAELAYEWSGLDNVSENILTAPTGYTVSLTQGSGYATSVNLPASGEHVYSEGDNSISYYLQQTSTGYIIPGTVIVKIDMTNPVLSKATVADENLTDTGALLEITAADTGSGIETYFVLFGTEEISGTGGSLVSRIKEDGKEYGVGMVSLTDLTPNTVYYYAICVTDQAGLVSTPVKGSFQTNKTATEITSQPTISGTYGQTVSQMLKAGVVKAGDMTVTGTWSVAEAIADTKLNAGTTEQITVTFVPTDSAYEQATAQVTPNVEKATPALKGIKRTSGTTLYHTMKQGDVELAGTADGVDGVDESVPGTFTLKDPDAYLSVGTNTYPVIFTPQESYRQNYSTAEGEITLTVVKNALLSIEIVNEPVKKNYVYGETMDLTGMTVKALYSSGDKVNVTQVVTCERTLAAGQTKLTIYYTEGGVTQSCELTGLNVEKADPTYTLPAGLTGICGTKLGDVALPSGFAWKADTDTVLRIATEAVGADGSTVIADAQTGKVSLEVVYTPEDTVNYNVVTDVVSVQLTHKETIKNAQRETCIADGYTGDVYCEECGIKLSGGQTVSATGLHDFTKQGSEGVCAVCGIVSLKLYAGIDVSVEDIYFDGKEHSADVIVTCDGKPLTVGADYTISGAVQTKAGAYEIAIAGTGNYTDTISVAWNIIPIGLWCAEIPDQVYTGSAIKPEVDVYQGSTLLTYGTDYTLSYANNINAGDATVTVKGKGNYAGTETATFKIMPVQLSDLSVPQEVSVAYTGSAQQIALTILFEGRILKADQDYKLSMSNVTAVGDYSVTVTGMGNYTGTAPVLVHVTEGKPVSKLKISKIAKQNYNDGREVTPAVTVKDGRTELAEGTHYTLAYADNRQVGTATVTITGIGDYAGSSTLTFQIVGTPISKAKVEGLTNPTYTGAQVQQTAANSVLGEVSKSGSTQGGTYRVTYGSKALTEGIDFTVSYQKNEKAGTATILFTGMGGYTGNMKKTFKILPYAVQGGTQSQTDGIGTIKGGLVTVTVADAVYTKGGAKPGLDIVFAGAAGTKQLKEGTDYTVTCKNNKALYAKAGSASDSKAPVAVIKFKGNFSGTVNAYYAITPQQLGNLNLVAEDKMPSTKKNAWKQTKVKIVDLDGKALKAGTDYDKTLVYTLADGTELNDESVAEAGTEIFVTAKGLGNYAGSELVGSYRIVNILISKAKVTVDIQEYTGDPVEPKPSSVTLGGIALKEGDYEIIGYANNVKKGTASMTIHGTGAYGGTKVVKFKIGTKRLQWSAK